MIPALLLGLAAAAAQDQAGVLYQSGNWSVEQVALVEGDANSYCTASLSGEGGMLSIGEDAEDSDVRWLSLSWGDQPLSEDSFTAQIDLLDAGGAQTGDYSFSMSTYQETASAEFPRDWAAAFGAAAHIRVAVPDHPGLMLDSSGGADALAALEKCVAAHPPRHSEPGQKKDGGWSVGS